MCIDVCVCVCARWGFYQTEKHEHLLGKLCVFVCVCSELTYLIVKKQGIIQGTHVTQHLLNRAKRLKYITSGSTYTTPHFGWASLLFYSLIYFIILRLHADWVG